MLLSLMLRKLQLSVTRSKEYLSKYLLEEKFGAMWTPKIST